MKTKYALFALCLPIAFTACQNEEFVKDYSQELKNRGEIDVILSANYPTVGNSVDTRMDATEEGKNLNFLWEQGTDKLGAAMMDGATPGQVAEQALVLVNSPFIAQDNGATSEFASPAPLTKGIYLFYNSYKDVLDREALSLSLQPQEFDPASQKTSVQQMVKYMNMVAPMVNLDKGITLADAATFNLPLEFVNLYTPVKVPVVFEGAKPGTKLTKISIDDKTPITLGGQLNTGVLAGASSFYDKVLVLKKDKSGKMTILPEDLAAAKEDVDAIVQNGAGSTGIYKDDASKVTGAAELTIKDGMDLSNGEQKEFWILIPRGKYTDLRITVETTNGTAEITRSIGSELVGGVNPQIFNSQHRALQTVVLDFSDEGNVTVPLTFPINNTEDWDNAIQYIQSNASAYMSTPATLTIGSEPVYITSIPTDIAFTLAGTDNPDSKLIFGDKDGKPVDIALNLKRITMDTYTHLEVGEGANVTINNNHVGTLASLTNNGTLTMKAIGTITALTNYSTLNFDVATVPNVVNKAGATINVKGTTTFTAFTNEAKAGEEDAAKIVVEKEASLTLAVGTTNKGVIVNNGTLANAGGFTNEGTVDNHGTLTVNSATWTNNGTIIARKEGVSNNQQITNNGGVVEVIDVAAFGSLGGGKQYNINGGTTNAVVTNFADYKTAKTKSMAITLDGDWTIKDGADDTKPELTAGEADYALNLKGNLNVEVDANLSSAGDITVSGDKSTITVAKGVNLTVKSLTVNEGATATIAGEGKVILPNDANVNVNGTLTNKGTLVTPETASIAAVGNVVKFNIVVAAGATLNNNATIGGEQNTQAHITSTGGSLDNAKGVIYGDVETAGFNSFTKGTVNAFNKILTSAIDLKPFAGATEIEASDAVTAIPVGKNTYIKFTGEALLAFSSADAEYGVLEFTNTTAGMSASASNVVIEKIIIGGSTTLTIDAAGGGNDITCKDVQGEGTLENSNSNHLVRPNGGGDWTL